jgi:hypothetical protein
MIREEPGFTTQSVLQKLGNIEEDSMSKFISRLSLNFSSSDYIASVERNEILEEKDTETDSYVFTNGCGLIDRDFLNEALKGKIKGGSSGIQIRMGGWKGVLTGVDLNRLGYPPHIKVVVRNSMKKFNTIFRENRVDINMIRAFSYSPAFFNN